MLTVKLWYIEKALKKDLSYQKKKKHIYRLAKKVLSPHAPLFSLMPITSNSIHFCTFTTAKNLRLKVLIYFWCKIYKVFLPVPLQLKL